MSNQLSNKISQYWHSVQSNLFPWLVEELGPLSAKQQELVQVLEFSRIEDHAKPAYWNGPGRPSACRQSMARSFLAKAVYNLPTTRALIDRLNSDCTLRRLCGWERMDQVPKEWSFSRAFAEFANNKLGEVAHEALIKTLLPDKLFGHVSRDATAIEAREKAVTKPKPEKPKPKRSRGRPKKSDCPTPKAEPKRIERQLKMTCLSQMLSDLPTDCDAASKINAKGYKHSWRGYKLHIDTVDGGIPVSCILTSASLHDSQVAIPLATMTKQRITNCYDLMDAAYDSGLIRYHSLQMGHVPLIDFNRRSKNDKRCFAPAEKERYKQRSSSERTNSSLKDNYNGSSIRVKGHAKVMSHLMFGIVALTVVQIIRLLH